MDVSIQLCSHISIFVNFVIRREMNIGEVLFYTFIVSAAAQLCYYLGIFGRLAFYRDKLNSNGWAQEPVSVLICAKDEADNLRKNLPYVLEQQYANYEVVVVNDCSQDETTDVLNNISGKYDHLKIVTVDASIGLPTGQAGKKFALTSGIKAATYDLLLLTDADCKPAGKFWLSAMQSRFTDGIDIVLGYGAFRKTDGFLNKLIRFDAFFIAMQYLSFALTGRAYMGVGRNLAYRRSLFIDNRGFESHHHISSGDDDLFINETATKNNIDIEISQDTHTISGAKTTFRDWFNQKRRHLTTGFHYKFNHKIFLGLHSLSRFLLFLTFIMLILLSYNIFIVLSLFAFRSIVQFVIFAKCMDKLGERDLLLFSPLYELFFVVFYPLVVLSNLIIKDHKWK